MHRRFSEKYPAKLRKLINQLSPTAATIDQLVAKSEYDSAFSMLKIFESQLNSDDQQLLTMTQSTYSQYLQDKKEGIVLTEHLNSALARVRKNILELSQKLQ